MCRSVSRRSLHTKYFPARIAYVRFHSFPAIENTSYAIALRLTRGQLSTSTAFIAWAFSVVVERVRVYLKTQEVQLCAPRWGSLLALRARTIGRNPMRGMPTQLGLTCLRLTAGLAVGRGHRHTRPCETDSSVSPPFTCANLHVGRYACRVTSFPTVRYLDMFCHLYSFWRQTYGIQICVTVSVFGRGRYHSEVTRRPCPSQNMSNVDDYKVPDCVTEAVCLIWIYSDVAVGVVDVRGCIIQQAQLWMFRSQTDQFRKESRQSSRTKPGGHALYVRVRVETSPTLSVE